jgi:hypothetical protein
MKYVVFISDQSCPDGLYTGPVAPQDAAYFTRGVLPHLQPLSEEEYLDGPPRYCTPVRVTATYSAAKTFTGAWNGNRALSW